MADTMDFLIITLLAIKVTEALEEPLSSAEMSDRRLNLYILIIPLLRK